MKNFVIKEMRLTDFKSQSRTFVPSDTRTFVKGANGVGKTTLYKAFCWLLTAYTDALNTKNHELYDSRKELTQDTPEASVWARIVVDDVEYTLERRAKAKFSRKRGSQEWTKDSSDQYKLFIDDLETSATFFNAWVEKNIGFVDLVPYMLMGERFANLAIDDKKEARKLLEQITGEITFDMMRGDYSMIAQDLKKYTIEQLLERYKTQLKPLNQRTTTIDALSDAKRQELQDMAFDDFEDLVERIKEKTKEINGVDQLILDASKKSEPLIRERENIIKKIHEKTVELGDRRMEYENSQRVEMAHLLNEIVDIERKNKEITKRNKERKNECDYNQSLMYAEKNRLVKLNEKRDALVKKRNECKARVFTDDKCAYCGQELPVDELARNRKRFNEEKEIELSCIIEQGLEVKKEIESCKARIEELKPKCSFEEESLLDKDTLTKEYDKRKAENAPFENTDEYKRLDNEINELNASIPNITSSNNDELIARKDALMKELQELNREYGKKAIIDKINNDIETLAIEKRNLGCEVARIEGCIATIKEYEEERARIISDKVNEKLDDCKIVMYSRQKDGTLKPDCVITNNDGVKYATLNNSARIATCLSLQRMFCKHFDVNLPIFVDEASVFDSEHLPSFDTQTIYLMASDDKTLKIEKV